jgi:hypothetical protein
MSVEKLHPIDQKIEELETELKNCAALEIPEILEIITEDIDILDLSEIVKDYLPQTELKGKDYDKRLKDYDFLVLSGELYLRNSKNGNEIDDNFQVKQILNLFLQVYFEKQRGINDNKISNIQETDSKQDISNNLGLNEFDVDDLLEATEDLDREKQSQLTAKMLMGERTLEINGKKITVRVKDVEWVGEDGEILSEFESENIVPEILKTALTNPNALSFNSESNQSTPQEIGQKTSTKITNLLENKKSLPENKELELKKINSFLSSFLGEIKKLPVFFRRMTVYPALLSLFYFSPIFKEEITKKPDFLEKISKNLNLGSKEISKMFENFLSSTLKDKEKHQKFELEQKKEVKSFLKALNDFKKPKK